MSTTPTFQITEFERRTRPGRMAGLVFDVAPTPAQQGWYAQIETAENSAELSKLDGEDRWTIDAMWGRGSFPIFSNGFGSRCTILQHPTDELAAALDERQRERAEA